MERQQQPEEKTCLACGQPKMVPLSTFFLISKALSGTSTVPQRKEEESRIAALNEEEKERRGKMKRKRGLLSDRLREVEERMKDDDATFLQDEPNSSSAQEPCGVEERGIQYWHSHVGN
ncbi:hypothetical protein G5714_000146 [Onychostoma macrolepis]|uniref:Uncharacterized protein n=1 Tax=Onychostoma macrolepis TaxID=369639 RepID=A0A7J6DGI6_9TELE|nr:hypothetical protein G5714_000146 [Onychostoma macrolepis]